MNSQNSPYPDHGQVALNPDLFGRDAKPAKPGLISLPRALLWLATGSKTIANDFKPERPWHANLDTDAKMTVEQSFAACGTLETIKTLGMRHPDTPKYTITERKRRGIRPANQRLTYRPHEAMPASVWFEPRFIDVYSGVYDISLREKGGAVWNDVLVSIEGFPIKSEQSYRKTQAPGTDGAEQDDQQAKLAPTAEDVLNWFRDVWKPNCDKKGIVPTRDKNQPPWLEMNDLDAAKHYFGCSVNRKLVRAARSEVAPEWTKGGRRSTKD